MGKVKAHIKGITGTKEQGGAAGLKVVELKGQSIHTPKSKRVKKELTPLAMANIWLAAGGEVELVYGESLAEAFTPVAVFLK